MGRENPHRPFVPDPAQMAHVPEVSGNTINGLGEGAPRQPRHVYWATNPDDIAHGAMQRWFYTVNPDAPQITEQRAARQKVLDTPLPPVAKTQHHQAPKTRTESLAQFVQAGDCEQIGVCALDPIWLFEGHKTDLPNVVVVGVQHDYDRISQAPEVEAGGEVMVQYTRAAAAAKTVAAWLRVQGYQAEPVTGPMATNLTLIPPALACGFGELGKHGSIINPKMGASFRLSAVLTDAPFQPTPAKEHGIDGFCQNCRICEDACPPEALSPVKQTVRGIEKWYVNFDACLPFFNQHHGCSICIAVCPWSRPGVGINLAAKLARRAARGENPSDTPMTPPT